jgi:ABC-type antimicrobial peptide transport system permease subunit
VTASVRSEVQQIDQDLPLFDTMTLAAFFNRNHWYLTVFGTLFLIFAMVALGMAAVGLYAVMAQGVSRRTREIGVRMALGADLRAIVQLVLGRGIIQLALGLVLGLAAALAVCRLMTGFLYMVSPSDPTTFASVALTLIATGLTATWLPARRAARLDPVKALRDE